MMMILRPLLSNLACYCNYFASIWPFFEFHGKLGETLHRHLHRTNQWKYFMWLLMVAQDLGSSFHLIHKFTISMARGKAKAPAAATPPKAPKAAAKAPAAPAVKTKGAPPLPTAPVVLGSQANFGLAKLAQGYLPHVMTTRVAPDSLYGAQQAASLELAAAMTKEIAASPHKLTQIQTHPLVILSATLLSTDWYSKTMSAKGFIQQDVGAFDARTARLAYNANAASAVWQTLIVCGEAHAESFTKVGLFAREYGSFMVQIGQSDTDLRQQFGGDPQSITLRDRGYGITTWDPAVVMLLALQCVSGLAARPDFNAALAYAIDRSMEPKPILDFCSRTHRCCTIGIPMQLKLVSTRSTLLWHGRLLVVLVIHFNFLERISRLIPHTCPPCCNPSWSCSISHSRDWCPESRVYSAMCPSLDKRSCGAVLNWLYADQQSGDQLHCWLSNPHVWRKLRRSAAPEGGQKWQIIKQASWPRCFHGAAISRIGWEQVRALRNSAVRAGASAAVRLYYLTQTCWATSLLKVFLLNS